jgi:hypothetical protein
MKISLFRHCYWLAQEHRVADAIPGAFVVAMSIITILCLAFCGHRNEPDPPVKIEYDWTTVRDIGPLQIPAEWGE